jgi:thiamine biosynthesis lipoprotein
MERIDFHAMGCDMSAALDSEEPEAALRLAGVPQWFRIWEGRLSRFLEDSELSQINRAPGQVHLISPVMAEVIQTAFEAAEASEGIVVPTILQALEAAGYDRSFDQITPRQTTLEVMPIFVGNWHEIEFNPRSRSLRTPKGVRLDLGGVAKGWAADRAAGRLSRFGPAMVDAGGDIAVSGPKADGRPWAIGVADPRNPEGRLALLQIKRGGVATSGRDYRRWKVNGDWRHHLIDPRTGQPAVTDVFSVTVVAPSVREAEISAKVVAVLGSQEGLEWLDQRKSVAGLLVLETEEVLQSQGMKSYLWS